MSLKEVTSDPPDRTEAAVSEDNIVVPEVGGSSVTEISDVVVGGVKVISEKVDVGEVVVDGVAVDGVAVLGVVVVPTEVDEVVGVSTPTEEVGEVVPSDVVAEVVASSGEAVADCRSSVFVVSGAALLLSTFKRCAAWKELIPAAIASWK